MRESELTIGDKDASVECKERELRNLWCCFRRCWSAAFMPLPALPPLALPPPINGGSAARPRNTSAVRIAGGERKTWQRRRREMRPSRSVPPGVSGLAGGVQRRRQRDPGDRVQGLGAPCGDGTEASVGGDAGGVGSWGG